MTINQRFNKNDLEKEEGGKKIPCSSRQSSRASSSIILLNVLYASSGGCGVHHSARGITLKQKFNEFPLKMKILSSVLRI